MRGCWLISLWVSKFLSLFSSLSRCLHFLRCFLSPIEQYLIMNVIDRVLQYNYLHFTAVTVFLRLFLITAESFSLARLIPFRYDIVQILLTNRKILFQSNFFLRLPDGILHQGLQGSVSINLYNHYPGVHWTHFRELGHLLNIPLPTYYSSIFLFHYLWAIIKFL